MFIMSAGKTGVLALIFVLFVAMPVFAHTDPMPTVSILAYHDDRPVKEVDTDVTIKIFADDTGFRAGVVWIELYEDGKFLARHACEQTPCTAEFNVHHDIKGRHSYAGYARDRGDNRKGATTSINFLGKDQPPILAFEDHPYAEEGYPLNLYIISEDKNKYPVNVTTSKLPRGAVFDGAFLKWTPDYNQSGTYSITFTAVNSKNLKTTKTLTIKVNDVNRPPEIISVSPDATAVQVLEGNKISFSMNVSDPDSKKPSFEWYLDNKKVSSSRTFTYEPDYDEAGLHTLVGRVVDKEFIRRRTWTVTVEDVPRPFVISAIKEKSIKEGERIRFRVEVKNPDKRPLTFAALSMPRGASFDPDTRYFEWIPDYGQSGVYDVVFTAQDQQGYRDSETVEITVMSEDVEPDFIKLYDLREKLIGQQLTTATVTSTQQILQLVNVSNVCNPGYLCYSVAYLVR
jgi:hypothetical protein